MCFRVGAAFYLLLCFALAIPTRSPTAISLRPDRIGDRTAGAGRQADELGQLACLAS